MTFVKAAIAGLILQSRLCVTKMRAIYGKAGKFHRKNLNDAHMPQECTFFHSKTCNILHNCAVSPYNKIGIWGRCGVVSGFSIPVDNRNIPLDQRGANHR